MELTHLGFAWGSRLQWPTVFKLEGQVFKLEGVGPVMYCSFNWEISVKREPP